MPRLFRTAAFLALLVLGGLIFTAAAQPPAPLPLPPSPARPAGEGGPTKVGYTVWLADVMGIDSAAQTFSVSVVLMARWQDPGLVHEGPGAKQYALEDIWHPNLVLVNETGETARTLPEVVDVAPDGTAVYRQRFIGGFSQPLDLRRFPFDEDRFRVRVVSIGHRAGDVEFVPDERATAAGMVDGIGMPAELTIQDWNITGATTRPSAYHVTPGIELAGYLFEFTATRRAHHFVIKVIIPLLLIVAMSWAVFWIEPADASTQMGVSVTAMLTLIAYRFAVDADVPKLPYLTRLDAFILMGSLMVFLSLIEVVITSKFANRGRLPLAQAIDRKCRWIFPVVFALGTAFTLRG